MRLVVFIERYLFSFLVGINKRTGCLGWVKSEKKCRDRTMSQGKWQQKQCSLEDREVVRVPNISFAS